jgi:hypothetical protein
MGETLSVTLDTSKDVVQPSLEEEAAKYDTPADDVNEERPEWLPEKFKSPEELAKAYSELQAKFSSRQKDVTEDSPVDNTDEPDQDVEEQAREAVEKAGLDFEDLSTRFWQNGGLADEDYSSLEQSGIPRNIVDQFIAGQLAIVEAQRSAVFANVGGEAVYNEMTAWAADNLSEAEIDSFNRAVNSPDTGMVVFAVNGLKARYEAVNGREPTRMVSGAAVKTSGEVYNSLAELQVDMSDPRYKNDPAFRRKVEQKLGRSDIM